MGAEGLELRAEGRGIERWWSHDPLSPNYKAKISSSHWKGETTYFKHLEEAEITLIREGIFNLDTWVDALLSGAGLYIMTCLAVFLASTHWMHAAHSWLWKPKMFPDIANYPVGDKIASVENHCSRGGCGKTWPGKAGGCGVRPNVEAIFKWISKITRGFENSPLENLKKIWWIFICLKWFRCWV